MSAPDPSPQDALPPGVRPEDVVEPAEIEIRRRRFSRGHPAGRAVALLLSIGLLMAGAGLQFPLLGVRASAEGLSTTVVGLVTAGYYLGYLVGSLSTPRMIATVGHIRAFAALASISSIAILGQAVLVAPVPWVLARFVTGICLAGLFVVAESWLNAEATNETRGRLLSMYMVVTFGGLTAGQLLLNLSDPAGFTLFVVSSILLSLAVVPTSLGPGAGPVLVSVVPVRIREVWHAAPLAVVGCALAGAAVGAALGLAPVFAVQAGYGDLRTSLFSSALIAGSIISLLPAGAVSDRVDRRLVIAGTAALASVAALFAAIDGADGSSTLLILLMAGVGAASIPLYPLSLAHLNDYLDDEKVVAAGARLVLVYGLGAALGPLVAVVMMGRMGPDGLLWFLVVVHATMAVYAAYRITRRRAVASDDRAVFVPMPVGATAQVAALAAEEEQITEDAP